MGSTWRGPLCLALWAVLVTSSWARPWLHLPLGLTWWHAATTPHTTVVTSPSPGPLAAAPVQSSKPLDQQHTGPKASAGATAAAAITRPSKPAAVAKASKLAASGGVALPGGATSSSSSSSAAAAGVVARQLPALHTLHLRNKCASPVAVAVHMKDASRGWVTRGWYKIPPGATVTTPRTHNPYFRYFAVTLSGPLVTWGGTKECRDCYYPGPSPGDDKYPFSAPQKMHGGGAYLWSLSCG